jgi:hypothetical protein
MHFGIGELDFQASREGLSYIPQTIDAIKQKLETVNSALSLVIAKEADTIVNLWDRAVFLYTKYNNNLWTTAVKKYVADTKLPTFDDSRYGGTKTFKIPVSDLASKYNIAVRGFNYSKHSKAYPNLKTDTDYNSIKNAAGHYEHTVYWSFHVGNNVEFVINDTKIGAIERAKHHYRVNKFENSSSVFVLEAVDKTKEMELKEFFNNICNPPENRIVKASTLEKKERADSGLGKNVNILKLEERGNGGYYRQREMVWRDAGKVDQFDNTKVYYYLPLSGFNIQSAYGLTDAKEFYNDLKECGIQGLNTVIYGVRKGDIEAIKTQKNWVNIEDYISKQLSNVNKQSLIGLAMSAIDSHDFIEYNTSIVDHVTNPNSPYLKLVNQFKGFTKVRYNEHSFQRLCSRYTKSMATDPKAVIELFINESSAVNKQYPLLSSIRGASKKEVAEYINLVDQVKGI